MKHAIKRLRSTVAMALGVPTAALRGAPDRLLEAIARGLALIEPRELMAWAQAQPEVAGLSGQERADRIFELCIAELARLGGWRGAGGGSEGGAATGGTPGGHRSGTCPLRSIPFTIVESVDWKRAA